MDSSTEYVPVLVYLITESHVADICGLQVKDAEDVVYDLSLRNLIPKDAY